MGKIYGIYSDDPNSTGELLAFGGSPDECRDALILACGEGSDDNCWCVEVTPALAAAEAGSAWRWLPGSANKIACTPDEL